MLHRSILAAALALGALAPLTAAAPAGDGAGTKTLTLAALAEGGLELTGPAGSRVLLLAGRWDAAGRDGERRVDPLRAAWLELDPSGHLRLPADRPDAPLFAQGWIPPAPGDSLGGTWSGVIVLLPQNPADKSVVQTGDIVVTEFMKDPTAVSDSHGEWIEIRNNLKWRCDVEGMILSDKSGASYVFTQGPGGIQLHPFRHFVLAADDDPQTNGGVPVDFLYTGFSLKNSSDEIYLHDSQGVLLDAVEYDDGLRWPDTPGMSISLDPSVTDPLQNDDAKWWCHSSSTYGSGGDTGTPGSPNDACP